jgi:hypothetical protein
MDLAQLMTRLGQLGVRPKDAYRAALYIDYLNDAQTYFTTTLAGTVPNGGFGADYPFVAPALRSATILQELSEILDFYVAPAVDADLRRAFAALPGGLGHGGPVGWTYADYFTNVILDANAGTFTNNIQAFRTRYPITAAALQQLSANFRGNIYLACRRVIADEALLTRFYEDLYEDDFAILALRRIKSTGSDFHKGGKQVLILTFDVVHTVDYGPPLMFGPKREQLKVVYKPSDLEADCLIAGNSAVVNRTLGGAPFMAASLFEIYNQRLQQIKTVNPAFTGEPVTTYRILPRAYLSAYAGPYPLPIRNAYGYIQYLDNDLSGTGFQVFGYYPGGESDYLIFQSQDRNAIVRSFYRQEGALAALCSSFSLVDMHIENLRVMRYRPYLIDLEISLTETIAAVDDTQLLGQWGGITGVQIMGQDFSWVVRRGVTPGQAYLDRVYPPVYYQNRLWSAAANRQKQTVAVSGPALLQGFTDGMNVLRACQQNNDFQAWFARLTSVVVRYLPFKTSDFKAVRTRIFVNQLFSTAPGVALAPTQDAQLRSFLTTEYNAFNPAAANPAPEPNFVTLTQTVSGLDYLAMDIPVFYHRIGTQEIIDSTGVQVPIPLQVTIDNPNGGTRQARVTGIGGIFNRATFFANQPTPTVVDQGQVQILAGAGFVPRLNLLSGTINTALGNAPASAIVGINA